MHERFPKKEKGNLENDDTGSVTEFLISYKKVFVACMHKTILRGTTTTTTCLIVEL